MRICRHRGLIVWRMTRISSIDLDELRTGPTAALFEGGPRAGTATTLHGFRNIGTEPLLVVSVHESPTLIQTFTDREPA
jgi:hypothetical protein